MERLIEIVEEAIKNGDISVNDELNFEEEA
jgi:hypothetical protein